MFISMIFSYTYKYAFQLGSQLVTPPLRLPVMTSIYLPTRCASKVLNPLSASHRDCKPHLYNSSFYAFYYPHVNTHTHYYHFIVETPPWNHYNHHRAPTKPKKLVNYNYYLNLCQTAQSSCVCRSIIYLCSTPLVRVFSGLKTPVRKGSRLWF